MTIFELKKLFRQELSEIYTESESSEIFSVFIQKITGFNKVLQRKFLHQEMLKSDIDDFMEILSQLKTGKPFQQILGETEFYGLKFFLNENVLIPRPETEELLELAIHQIQGSKFKVQGLKILDIGTGSGIIPIVLKKYFQKAEITAIDISEEALKIARKNAEFHKTEISFLQKDYLNENLEEKYHIIISNPPYIGIDEETEIADSVKEFEPKTALFSPTRNPLIFYEKIAEDCTNFLHEKGMVFLEINQKLGKETADLFRNVLSEVSVIKDISGNDRFIFGFKY